MAAAVNQPGYGEGSVWFRHAGQIVHFGQSVWACRKCKLLHRACRRPHRCSECGSSALYFYQFETSIGCHCYYCKGAAIQAAKRLERWSRNRERAERRWEHERFLMKWNWPGQGEFDVSQLMRTEEERTG